MPTPWEFIFLIQERSLSPGSPAVPFELLLPRCHPGVCFEAWGWGGRQPPRQSDAKQREAFLMRLSKNDTN